MRLALLVVVTSGAALGCRDASRFDTHGDHYEGAVTSGSFVRSGVSAGTRMCLTLDTSRLQDAPGTLTTSDGRFRATPLRPIPQLWHDPLSTLAFGDGRTQNLVYAAAPVEDGGASADAMAFVSLMQSGSVEVRLVRGAPQPAEAPATAPTPLFGVFTLDRHEGACPL